MIFIELQNIKLQAFHGIYAGERKTGNPFELNIRVGYEEGKTEFEKLSDTIDYEVIFSIVKQHMQSATPLLEKAAQGIIREIKKRYPFTKEIAVSIFKLEAPIENFQGKVGISMVERFD